MYEYFCQKIVIFCISQNSIYIKTKFLAYNLDVYM